MDLLVCGGAGYIGGFLSKMLVEQGHKVVVFDNLRVGLRENTLHPGIEFVEGNLLNERELCRLFHNHHFMGVFHMATISPYTIDSQNIHHSHENNITGTLNLLSQMHIANVNNIVFASSGLVYGTPTRGKLGVTVPTAPETPFATTNVTIEGMLTDFYEANGLSSVSLRFNNASGIAEQYHHYQWHDANPPELVKLLKAFLPNDAPAFEVPDHNDSEDDSSPVRDYVHVLDVCDAFIKAMLYLQQGEQGAQKINLGSNGGISYKSLLEIAKRVSGTQSGNTHIVAASEEHSPKVQTLSSLRAKRLLGWEPKYSPEDILQSLWQYMIQPRIDPVIDDFNKALGQTTKDSYTVASNERLIDKIELLGDTMVSEEIAKSQ
jgi:UDP-glucose 4-epimerase